MAENPSSADFRRLLANTYQNDGDYRAILHDVDGALQSFRKKLTFDEQALAEDPLNAVARCGYRVHVREEWATCWRRPAVTPRRFRITARPWPSYEKLGAESSEDLYRRFRAIMVRGGIGEMQAHLGERSAALAESSRAIAMLDGIAADPTSGTHSSLRGQVYMRVAAAYAALGASAKLGAAEQREHWRTARDLYARSLDVWQDMQKRGILTAEDGTKPQEVAREIARCDAACRRQLDQGDVHLAQGGRIPGAR